MTHDSMPCIIPILAPISKDMTVIPFPVLTIEAIIPRDWEPVLSLPLPKRPNLPLLEAARRQVLLYLDWMMTEMVFTEDTSVIHREILRATNRLLEIAEAMPAAIDANTDRCLGISDAQSLAWVLQRTNDNEKLRRAIAALENL
jgi:hypothetical protein